MLLCQKNAEDFLSRRKPKEEQSCTSGDVTDSTDVTDVTDVRIFY